MANNIFKHIRVRRPKRSSFDLSHDVKLTMNMGKLVPFLCEEVVPGDTWYNKSNILLRFAPLKAPVMHRINLYTHFYYVPFRLLWDEYEEFITGGEDGRSAPSFPRLEIGQSEHPNNDFYDADDLWSPGSLADYLNYPTTESHSFGGMQVSALPFRAYQMIYNEYYRDENLELDLDINLSSGKITFDSDEYKKLLTLRDRAWAKDYFTSALPWTQRGPQQNVPIVGIGEVLDSQHPSFVRGQGESISSYVDFGNPSSSNSTPLLFREAMESVSGQSPVTQRGYLGVFDQPGADSGVVAAIDNSKNLDLSGVEVSLNGGTFNINDLRRANRIQKWLERQARGGSRYIEALLAHFGVESDDLRLQRPEFLGGGRTPVQIGDVLQTSESTQSSPQGQPSGTGFAFGTSNSFKRTFKERGLIIGIMSVMPVPSYTEGLPRAYKKFDKFDFYWPEFAQLGEQEIYNYELSLKDSTVAYDTFGYAPRYAEYKYIPGRSHGDFKTTLDFWTLNRKFASQPTLSEEFIHCNADEDDLNRIFAVQDAGFAPLWVQIYNETKARRPMPYLPEPSL